MPLGEINTFPFRTVKVKLTSWSSFCFSLRRRVMVGWSRVTPKMGTKCNEYRELAKGWLVEANDLNLDSLPFPILVNRSVHSKSRVGIRSPFAVRCPFLTLNQG